MITDKIVSKFTSSALYNRLLHFTPVRLFEFLQIDEELKTLSYPYASFRRKGSIGPMQVYIVKPGTFKDLRAFMIENTTGSPNQYKVPRVLKKAEAVKFVMDRIETCLL